MPRFSTPLPPELHDGATLRELIAATVAIERSAAAERAAASAVRRVLTEQDLRQGAITGAYRSTARDEPAPPLPPLDATITTALEAFADGLYLVVVDGVQRTDLDESLSLTDDSTVTYLRLVALVGG